MPEYLSSEQFNFIEGLFWVALGLLVLFINDRYGKKYKKLGIFSSVVLITFGVSDFVQVLYGSFFQPSLWWLFLWKIVDVVGLIVMVFWYLFLRIAKK